MQKAESKKGNMYKDAFTWNCFVGCLYQCKYCIPSFQAQMKRFKPTIDKNGKKRGCQLCYDYIPHFHPERLDNKLRRTYGDQFIWACSSGDITFAKKEWIEQILEKVRKCSNRTFFFQTKNPECFNNYNFPDNVLLGITLESNRYYPNISKAPNPETRYNDFLNLDFPRKVITIEPILQFDLAKFSQWIRNINPERVYIGYDTHKSGLIEPRLAQTKSLIQHLSIFTKVKTKLIRERYPIQTKITA